MPNDSKLRILGKKVIMEKSQNCGGNSLVSPPKTIFGSSTQKLCKSRHLSFLVLLVLSNYTSFFLIFPKIFSKLQTSEHKLNFNDFSNYSYKLKNTYTVTISSHFGFTDFLYISVFRGGSPSTITSA